MRTKGNKKNALIKATTKSYKSDKNHGKERRQKTTKKSRKKNVTKKEATKKMVTMVQKRQ